MRRITGSFGAFLAIALFFCFCVVPTLNGVEPADGQASPAAVAQTAPSRGTAGIEDRLRFSQPLWLLLSGTALIVSANWLSRALQARARSPLPEPLFSATEDSSTTKQGSVPASRS